MNYWLMKSEPTNYSIQDLKRDKKTAWTGVRNYQARNFMTQSMEMGDLAIFYHSNAEPPGAVGVMKIASAAHADETAFDKKSMYYEPRATREKPVWECVDVAFVEEFPELLPLAEIRKNKRCAKMELLKTGSRLSIQPLTKAEFEELLLMGKK